jgi:hypothetical protein
MTLHKWKAINKCIHLVDNRMVEKDPFSSRYDVLAKTRWFLEYSSCRSRELYNPEAMLIIDELVVPYKGWFAHIR